MAPCYKHGATVHVPSRLLEINLKNKKLRYFLNRQSVSFTATRVITAPKPKTPDRGKTQK